ncbi:hypothetical protein CR205_15435 [Alteribacter lacisalsi]|uniref:Uncharacterized protein n=1 Tax=Alteribacter lacisalsi TaxID=2045244 RepID=A0A2W0HFW6_9BACI|nr:hypothetical protein CR205_15435 [Alteribacter lacisalsi]
MTEASLRCLFLVLFFIEYMIFAEQGQFTHIECVFTPIQTTVLKMLLLHHNLNRPGRVHNRLTTKETPERSEKNSRSQGNKKEITADFRTGRYIIGRYK